MAGAERVRWREGGGEGREVTEQVEQDFVGCREDLGFYPEGGGSPEGLCAEGSGDLIQAHRPERLLQGG